MQVLLFGVGYFPRLLTGDKNFFFRLMPRLAERLERLVIVSLNDHRGVDQQPVRGTVVPLHNLQRPFHRRRQRFYGTVGDRFYYHHQHRPAQEIPERLLAVLVHLPRLRRIIRQEGIQIVHFMDNFGPAMPLLRALFPGCRFTASAPTYNPRGWCYDRYLWFSFRSLHRILPYTEAYRTQLERIGLPAGQLRVVHWGVEPRMEWRGLSPAERAAVRAAAGLPTEGRLVLWSGFIQQVGEADFYAALSAAREVAAVLTDVAFLFAFKPESFDPRYAREADERIWVRCGVPDFGALLETADLFYSPILATGSTVAPPLTWLEAMARGTPVLTTFLPGVDELLADEETGYVAAGPEELVTKLQAALADDQLLTRVGERARAVIDAQFSLAAVAESYLQVWNEVMNG